MAVDNLLVPFVAEMVLLTDVLYTPVVSGYVHEFGYVSGLCWHQGAMVRACPGRPACAEAHSGVR
jgi:hypothetical protein